MKQGYGDIEMHCFMITNALRFCNELLKQQASGFLFFDFVHIAIAIPRCSDIHKGLSNGDNNGRNSQNCLIFHNEKGGKGR